MNSKISTAMNAWIEQDRKSQRKLGEQVCAAYVANPSALNGTCAGLPKTPDCIKPSEQVPRKIVEKLFKRFEEASQSMDGLYAATPWYTYDEARIADPSMTKPQSANLLALEKPGLMLTTTRVLNFARATTSFKEIVKEWLDITQDLDIMVFKFVNLRGVKVPRELARQYHVNMNLGVYEYMLLPGTKLQFAGCTKIKNKSNKTLRAFKWIATSDTKMQKIEKATNKNDLQLLEALNYYFEHLWEIDHMLASKTLRTCTPKEAKTYSTPKLQSLAKTYQEVEALRLLTKPVFATVFRGTKTMFPFVVPTRNRAWTLEEMQKTKYYKLDHLLSTSTSKEVATSGPFMGGNLEKISFKAERVKATYLHVMELQGVSGIDIARLLDDMLARNLEVNGLMAREHEILVMPGRDVLFELVKVERFDQPITSISKDRKVVCVGDIIPQESAKFSKLVKKKINEVDFKPPQKRKAHQMMNKTKELLKQADGYEWHPTKRELVMPNIKRTIVKDGRVVLYWKVRPVWAWPIECQTMRGLYDQDAAFPGWSCFKELNLDFRATRVFYDEKDKLVDIKRLALEREPCNIAMSKHFDEAKLQTQFGYSESYYTRYAKAHPTKLPPNIAIYTKTLVNMEQVTKLVTQQVVPTSIGSWFQAKKKKQEVALFKRVHVISLVGLAFDHPSQPDFMFYGEAPSIAKLVKAYTCIWRKAFECAKYWNLPTIVATQVGNGAFKPEFISYQEFKSDIHDKVLSNMKKAYPEVKVVEPRNVFNMIDKLDQAKLDDLLFVNSWDPHSMLGNGNRIDDSLDGKFGRCSAIAVLGWPGTNLHVRYKNV